MRAIKLYIPIWYNSSDRYSGGYNRKTDLYIPIWYNSSTVIPYLLEEMDYTLHSNLVQFKPRSRPQKTPEFCPLHSNLVQFKLSLDIGIYYPFSTFTFQSGTIQACSNCKVLKIRIVFTFQSGTIQARPEMGE